MGRNLRLLTVLLPLLLSLPTSAWAKGDLYDLEFNRLVNQTKIDQNGFNHVVRDMAIAMAPKFLGPAATLGSLGFEIAYEMSWTDIVEDSDHWQTVIGDGQEPDSALTTMQVHIRKGLPFSLEIGGNLTHLFKSDLWGVGLDVKFAPIEGFRYLPDLAFRANVNTVLGAGDIHMLLAGGDMIVSKEFGIAGLFRLAPYTGYNLVYVLGQSHQITFFPTESTDPCDGAESCVHLFDNVSEVVHRGVVGLQFVAAYVSLGAEVALTSETQTYTMHVGADF